MSLRRLLPGRSLALLFAAATLWGCGESGSAVGPDLGLAPIGSFRGVTRATEPGSALFTATRSGRANVAICGPEGVNFDLVVRTDFGDDTVSTPSNCERAFLTVRAGNSYRVTVLAVSGEGPFSGCFTTFEFVECTVGSPYAFDPSVPVDYYDDALGLTGTALIEALNDIISSGHRVLGYDTARDSLYANADDPDNDNIIRDVYTDRAATVFNRPTANTANFNAEHSWPQSRGANEDPANSDIHVLFAADATANGQRSNHPFGTVTGTVLWEGPADSNGDRSRLGLDAQGRTVFEPRDARKGDIARALLYFYVRYVPEGSQTPSLSLANFNIEEATLLEWALDPDIDPVDAHERGRNNVIFRAQGNRNPFVDRPEFASEIGDFPNVVP